MNSVVECRRKRNAREGASNASSIKVIARHSDGRSEVGVGDKCPL
jgi:hypothetical protein